MYKRQLYGLLAAYVGVSLTTPLWGPILQKLSGQGGVCWVSAGWWERKREGEIGGLGGSWARRCRVRVGGKGGGRVKSVGARFGEGARAGGG